MYKAISYFKDMKDNMHSYNPGDTFPRDGLTVSEKRLEELSTNKNRRGKPVIEFVEEPIEEEKVEEVIAEEPEVEEITEEKPKKRGRSKKNAD